jgi:hypothetical protein
VGVRARRVSDVDYGAWLSKVCPGVIGSGVDSQGIDKQWSR